MREQYPVRFNAVALIEHFGGAAALYDILCSMGCSCKRRTVDKWRQRGSIPSDVLAAMMLYAARGGDNLDLNRFLLEREE